MFNTIKNLKSTKHEVAVNVKVDATRVCKPIVKTVAYIAAISLAQSVALKLLDEKFPTARTNHPS